MYKKSQIISGMIMNVIIILVIAKLATGSLNPVEVFSGEDLFLKVLVGFFFFSLAMCVFLLLFRRGFANHRCAMDGLPLLDYVGSHGNPVRCSYCGRWYHTRCFQAGGGSLMGGCKQPHCSSCRDK